MVAAPFHRWHILHADADSSPQRSWANENIPNISQFRIFIISGFWGVKGGGTQCFKSVSRRNLRPVIIRPLTDIGAPFTDAVFYILGFYMSNQKSPRGSCEPRIIFEISKSRIFETSGFGEGKCGKDGFNTVTSEISDQWPYEL